MDLYATVYPNGVLLQGAPERGLRNGVFIESDEPFELDPVQLNVVKNLLLPLAPPGEEVLLFFVKRD